MAHVLGAGVPAALEQVPQVPAAAAARQLGLAAVGLLLHAPWTHEHTFGGVSFGFEA